MLLTGSMFGSPRVVLANAQPGPMFPAGKSQRIWVNRVDSEGVKEVNGVKTLFEGASPKAGGTAAGVQSGTPGVESLLTKMKTAAYHNRNRFWLAVNSSRQANGILSLQGLVWAEMESADIDPAFSLRTNDVRVQSILLSMRVEKSKLELARVG